MKQNTPEWYEERRPLITGSIVGAILGMSPFMTRDQAMRAKVRDWNNLPQEIDTYTKDVIFAYGHQYEPVAIEYFELETGLTVERCGIFKKGILGASPDGLCGENAVVEIKCPWSERESAVFESIHDLPHYHAQLQLEMHCSGRTLAHFYQWSQYGQKYETVDYNPDWFVEHMPAIEAFYAEFIKKRDNPGDFEKLQLDTIYINKLLQEYDDTKMSIEIAQARIKDIMKEFIKETKEQDAILGGGRKLTKCTRKGSVSYADIVKQELPNFDTEPFTGEPSEYWRLS